MKQINGNQYIKSFGFKTSQECSTFVSNQGIKNILSLDETYGDNSICYVCYNSLTHEKLFIITFSTDEDENNLSLLHWNESHLLVLDTGKEIYLIDNNLNLKSSLEVTTPLAGLYLTKGNNLLILEEASMRLISSKGEVLKSELFDLIENFSIVGSLLSIKTSEGSKVFDLV